MSSKTKDADLERLAEIRQEINDLEAALKRLYDERCLIWDRRVKAGDCAMTSQPKDRGQSELARISGVGRAQVMQGIEPARLAKARKRTRAA